LYSFKARAKSVIAQTLCVPEPQASLLTGILLGDDSGIPKNVQDAFRTTGTSHILAISSYIGTQTKSSIEVKICFWNFLPGRNNWPLVSGSLFAWPGLARSRSIVPACQSGYSFTVAADSNLFLIHGSSLRAGVILAQIEVKFEAATY